MELYEVTVQYLAPSLVADWEKRLNQHVRLNPQIPFDEPRPKPCEVNRHVAVHPDYGFAPIAEAARLGLTSVVGAEKEWERFQAQAIGVRYVGSVAVQELA